VNGEPPTSNESPADRSAQPITAGSDWPVAQNVLRQAAQNNWMLRC
jgi:hypothetical protein